MGSINKPSIKPVTPGKIVIRKGEIEGPPYYWLHLNEPDFNLDELEEVGNQILSLVKAARKENMK